MRTSIGLPNADFIYKKKQKSGKYIRCRAARFNFGLHDLLRPGSGYVLVVHYQLNRQPCLNVETIPAFSASFTFVERGLNRFGINGEVDINNIALSVLYRFGG